MHQQAFECDSEVNISQGEILLILNILKVGMGK